MAKSAQPELDDEPRPAFFHPHVIAKAFAALVMRRLVHQAQLNLFIGTGRMFGYVQTGRWGNIEKMLDVLANEIRKVDMDCDISLADPRLSDGPAEPDHCRTHPSQGVLVIIGRKSDLGEDRMRPVTQMPHDGVLVLITTTSPVRMRPAQP